MRRAWLGIGCGLALLLGACSESARHASEQPLRAPYDITRLLSPSDMTAPQPEARCRTFDKPPVTNLKFATFYEDGDPTRSRVDPDARKAYTDATRDLRRYENALMRMANDYIASAGRRPDRAACALGYLYQWATADALLGQANTQGEFVRQWTLATLSSAYLQIRSESTLDDAQKKSVEKWLRALAAAVVKTNNARNTRPETQNNHMYWAAWAVTVTGIALNDNDFYGWGINRVRTALNLQINGDGSLPLEMNRGSKALHYHVFALAPLIMVAEAGAANGDDLYVDRDGVLHKLVHLVWSGLNDPSYFEERAGTAQESARTMNTGHFAWLEAYNARFPDAALEDWLSRNRPLVSRRTGGNMTQLYRP